MKMLAITDLTIHLFQFNHEKVTHVESDEGGNKNSALLA